ncbi:MAG: helix-turn-helix transcriptional regulator [Bacillota bacterium]
MYFAERLKALRERHHMTQEELARQLNITRQAVGNYEQGTRFPKDEKILKAIADLFDVPLDDLFGRNRQRKIYDASKDNLHDMFFESGSIYEADKLAVLKELIQAVSDLPIETILKIKEVIEIFRK